MEAEHLNDSLGNPGLISPDKEDLSRLLVRKMPEHSLKCIYIYQHAPGCAVSPVHFAQTVPFSGRIRGGMRPGKKIIVMGIVDLEPDR